MIALRVAAEPELDTDALEVGALDDVGTELDSRARQRRAEPDATSLQLSVEDAP